jgi:flagellar biosynthetic protein FliR
VLGLTMGWMAMVLFSAIHLAGTMMGFQVGTGVSQLFDHQISGSSGELGRLMTSLVGLAVVVAGGHHLLVRGLMSSFDRIPVGGQWLDADLGLVASRLFGGVLVAGCEMALPVVAVTTLSTVAIGLATKATPQLNVYFAFGLLLNLILGLIVTSMVLQHPLGGIDQLVAWLVRASLLPLE